MKTILMAVGTMADASLRTITEKMVERIGHLCLSSIVNWLMSRLHVR